MTDAEQMMERGRIAHDTALTKALTAIHPCFRAGITPTGRITVTMLTPSVLDKNQTRNNTWIIQTDLPAGSPANLVAQAVWDDLVELGKALKPTFQPPKP